MIITNLPARLRPATPLLAMGLMMMLLAGCGGGAGGELAPDRFYRPQPPGTDETRHVLLDRPEPAMYNQLQVHPFSGKTSLVPELEEAHNANIPPQPVTEVSRASSELAEATGRLPSATQPSTRPSTRAAQNGDREREVVPPGFAGAGGQAITLGAIVVRVNNQPIYADKVLALIAPVLAAEARQRDPDSFRKFAANEIEQQIKELVKSELVFGQAQQTLVAQEKEIADRVTMIWRQQQITKAGGSLEQARAAAAAEGKTFEDMVQDQYRIHMVGIYYQKKIYPRAEVTAQDMRQYYERNRERMFSEADSIQFRLIRIDIKQAGRDDALKKVTDLRDRITKGEDFATLAGQFSDDARLAKNGGLEDSIQRGSYAVSKIEDAAWNLQPGQVSDVIDAGKAFYLVKLESRKAGHTQPFEDPAVQARIKDLLTKERMRPLIDKEQKRLIEQSAIDPDPPNTEPVVEMAMQNYSRWAQRAAR